MTKHEFITRLREGLVQLPKAEVEEHIAFYGEIIDDRMEEGFLESEAVANIGSVDIVISQILNDYRTNSCGKDMNATKRLGGWEIMLLVLGSPIWLSLLIAAVTVLFSLFIIVWSVVVSLWAVFVALSGCVVGVGLAGVVFCCNGFWVPGIAMISVGAICGGLSILAFFGCKSVTRGIAVFTKWSILWVRNKILSKEAL